MKAEGYVCVHALSIADWEVCAIVGEGQTAAACEYRQRGNTESSVAFVILQRNRKGVGMIANLAPSILRGDRAGPMTVEEKRSSPRS